MNHMFIINFDILEHEIAFFLNYILCEVKNNDEIR